MKPVDVQEAEAGADLLASLSDEFVLQIVIRLAQRLGAGERRLLFKSIARSIIWGRVLHRAGDQIPKTGSREQDLAFLLKADIDELFSRRGQRGEANC